MIHSPYPSGTVRALLDTDLVTPATRRALQDRLTATSRPPQFFTAAEFALLKRIADRLIPQPDRTHPIDLVGDIDQRLTDGTTDGWRYDAMPADGDAFRLGLQGIDETAQTTYNQSFLSLTDAEQDDVLLRIQRNDAGLSRVWQQLPADRFFEELLAEVTGIYYAHPLGQEEIGYAGMADAIAADPPGWTRTGLNEREAREPKPVSL
ncbi:MAG: gluconate 2-dehydrogenase subunit 3 family protein [Bacteroidetes bacterium]|nr:gluconate 2-dehydrogenase subunit 3 family protein [Fibrella sp.]